MTSMQPVAPVTTNLVNPTNTIKTLLQCSWVDTKVSAMDLHYTCCQNFGATHETIPQLWKCTELACVHGLIISPEINSWKNAMGRRSTYFFTRFTGSISETHFAKSVTQKKLAEKLKVDRSNVWMVA